MLYCSPPLEQTIERKIMIYTDTFLEIGSQHKVCEDYIVTCETPFPCVILSDGCSSSKNTEMGSRLLCYLAKQFLTYRKNCIANVDYKDMGRWIIHNAEMTARQLGLKKECLDATLLISFFIDNKIRTFIYGDGVVVFKRGDTFEITSIEYNNNMPYYLSYLIDEERNQCYYEKKNQKLLKKTIIGTEEIEKRVAYTFAYDYPTIIEYDLEYNDVFLVCSDGIESFIDHTGKKLDIKDTIKEFTAFKNLKGMYLQRRLNAALKNMKKVDVNHYDDLSVGSFILLKED